MDPLFDWKYYLAKYEDLRNCGINTEQQAILHWNNHGKNESRISYGVKLFTMVKDEADIVREWILYHGNLVGFEQLYIVDNGSTDGTWEIIQSFIQKGIHIFQEADYRKKGIIMTSLIREHSKRGIAYPLDIDEFIVYYDKSNRTISADKDTIMSYFYGLPPSIVYKTNYIYNIINNPLGYNNALLDSTSGYYSDYGKLAKSFFTSSLFTGTIDHGNHYPNESFMVTDLCLIHYHHRNLAQMKKKIINNVSGLGYNATDLHSLKNLPKDCMGYHHVIGLISILEGRYQLPLFNGLPSDQTISLTPFSDAMRLLL